MDWRKKQIRKIENLLDKCATFHYGKTNLDDIALVSIYVNNLMTRLDNLMNYEFYIYDNLALIIEKEINIIDKWFLDKGI